ncbi:hypothetical protein [Cytophaga sp. FL35]|uniref:hypothetical protein n=1 Tax=Cytophaga sp. FL35 TaxID=1904456 RepID=UPI001653443B|nr:hypothetical protein [Cytophaga sp. FL35]MBC6999865.1 hypothetical protein [Cytophaga sp. FL35]
MTQDNNPLELYGLERSHIPFGKLKNHTDSLNVPENLKENFIAFCDSQRQTCSYSIGIFDKMEIWRTPYELYYALYEFAHNSCKDYNCSKYFAFFKYEEMSDSSSQGDTAKTMLEKLYDLEEKVGGQKVDSFDAERGNAVNLRLWGRKIIVRLNNSYKNLEVNYPYLEFHLEH